MAQIIDIPWWGSLAIAAGGVVVGAFAPSVLPIEWHSIAFSAGIVFVAIGAWSFLESLLSAREVKDRHQMGIFLVVISGLLAAGSIATGISAYRHFQSDPTKSPSEQTQTTHATSEETGSKSLRHYSSSDKDRISESFYEIAEILNKKAAPIEREAQWLIQIWNRNDSNSTDADLGIDLILERLRTIELSSSEINMEIYSEWLNKYQKYGGLLKEKILANGVERDRPIRVFQEAARNFNSRLITIGALYESVPSKKAELVEIFRPTMEVFRDATGILNGWIHQTNLRIEKLENEILSRS